MTRPVRIGNAHGFWGDRIEAAAEMLAAEPDLDYVTLDFLAEVSMSLLAVQRSRDPQAGWPRDVVEVVRSLIPYWSGGGRCRLITNGGGLNPLACAQACQQVLLEAGCGDRVVAIVTGDDVLETLRAETVDAPLHSNLDTGEPLSSVRERLVTANAYLGAQPLAEALARGADIVITGRVADPSLTVAACAHFHGWAWDDWPRLAGATVAGHLIECGTQVTGGISTDWLSVPNAERIGFPIVEVAEDASFIVTKPRGTGGCVNEQTVKEQLVYEIGDPGEYLSPDVSVSFLSLQVVEESPDRVRVSDAVGRPAPATYKISATYRGGFRAAGELTIYGVDAVAKARRAGQTVLDRLRHQGVTFRESVVECLGAGACHPRGTPANAAEQLTETVLRIAVADDSLAAVERFSRELMPLITAGPPGTTGYAAGRPRVQPVFRYWPCLIERDRITPRVDVLSHTTSGEQVEVTSGERGGVSHDSLSAKALAAGHLPPRSPECFLGDIATARSGDKGIHANIGVIARRADDFERLLQEVTVERVAAHLGIDDLDRVQRFELPNLGALNFVIRRILANSLRVDAQGKTLGQLLLLMPLEKSL
ncbi:MAG: acyclic terpene utilization AtuA family protein [Planctomycetaceae bacterium]